MSATELKDRILRELDGRIAQRIKGALDLRYRPAQIVTRQDGSTYAVPGVSAEEIALVTIEANAYRRGLEDAAEVVTEQHQKLVAPEPNLVERAEKNGDEDEAIY